MIFFCLKLYPTTSNQIHQRLLSRVARNMENSLKPPHGVYLMDNLNKAAFQKFVKVPVINTSKAKVSSVLPILRNYLLKIEQFKPIEHVNSDNVSVYLNPEIIEKWQDFAEDERKSLEAQEVSEDNWKLQPLTLKYENYTFEHILQAILPKDKEGFASFTKVGHIVHVNLREHLLPYKNIIGEVLFDKISGCKSVVNKINSIDNTYRNFQMEVLRGEHNMLTAVKENNCRFEFDFSTVYWNSRLCTEHERIVKLLQPNDVLFDVFAGVGPFSIPAAKKQCMVFANDLNPESYKWLLHNKKLNKISDQYFSGYNLDGREFILTVIKENLTKYLADHKVYIVMNLPGMAMEFLDAFVHLFENADSFRPATVFVYCFAKGENPEQIATDLVQQNLKNIDVKLKISDVFRVRTVSSMKEMMRVTLSLDKDVLVGSNKKRKIDYDIDCEVGKKMCSGDKDGQEQKEDQGRVQGGRSKEFEDENQS